MYDILNLFRKLLRRFVSPNYVLLSIVITFSIYTIVLYIWQIGTLASCIYNSISLLIIIIIILN